MNDFYEDYAIAVKTLTKQDYLGCYEDEYYAISVKTIAELVVVPLKKITRLSELIYEAYLFQIKPNSDKSTSNLVGVNKNFFWGGGGG